MMGHVDRRSFLKRSLSLSAALIGITQVPERSFAKTTQVNVGGFFTLRRSKDRWWLITPDGDPFFTIGLNHIDPASLRYPENIHIWREKYGGSNIRWIKESVAPNLKAWGFNSVGCVQEVTVRQWQHSRSFTRNNGKWYTETLEALFDQPGCIGFHLCGAYQRNKARRYGLLDAFEKPDKENVELIQAFNKRISKRIQSEY